MNNRLQKLLYQSLNAEAIAFKARSVLKVLKDARREASIFRSNPKDLFTFSAVQRTRRCEVCCTLAARFEEQLSHCTLMDHATAVE